MSNAKRTRRERIVAEMVDTFPEPLSVEEAYSVRGRLAALMDRLAQEVFASGLDLDDCIADRFVTARRTGSRQTVRVALESLTDLDGLRRACEAAFASAGVRDDSDERIELLGFVARALRAPDYPDQTRRS